MQILENLIMNSDMGTAVPLIQEKIYTLANFSTWLQFLTHEIKYSLRGYLKVFDNYIGWSYINWRQDSNLISQIRHHYR